MLSGVEAFHPNLLRRYESYYSICYCGVIQDVFILVEKVATTNSPVLIHDENVVGKELVAQALHNTFQGT